MKVSLNWVKQYTKVDLPTDVLVKRIGEQLGAVEEVEDLGKLYKGILVVKVVESEKHPNADKLHVCMIDDGGKATGVKRNAKGLVQVVCGAPNVQAGMLAAWIPPGLAVPSTVGNDPFVLEAKELRGVVSNGMLASAKELAIGDSHEGLLVIDKPAKPGDALAEVYELNDHIIDIENKMFTHRPDCFGMLGVAREIAGITGKKFVSPKWYAAKNRPAEGFGLELSVKNDAAKVVPRFTAIAMKNVSVGPSPVELQTWLSRVGVRPINNIVDITNYVMLLSGQPVHAYDYDKVKTGILGVRLSKKGEELKLLNGKTLKLNDGAVMITDGKKPIGLGGVMGGAETEVDASTKNIILEAASFDMNLTRKTAMAYGLFTDAVTRFTKGQSPLQNTAVQALLVEQVEKLAGGEVASQMVDVSSGMSEPKPVKVSADFINSRLGEKLSAEQIKKLLENVEFSVSSSGHELKVQPPFWRTDIEIPEDLVEEVGRLYGYDKLPQTLPMRSVAPASIEPMLAFKSRVRDILVSAGANEVLTYSFVNEKQVRDVGQDPANSYHIKNALSPDLQYYRQGLMPSLLEKVHPNIKQGYDEFALFEIGKIHFKGMLDEQKLPAEPNYLALTVASKNAKGGAPYYWAKQICEYLLAELNIKVRYEPLLKETSQKATYCELSRTAEIKIDDQVVGRVSEFKAQVAAAFKLPKYCAGFTLRLDEVIEAAAQIKYEPLNRFPATEQDVTLRAPAEHNYQELTDFVDSQLASAAKEHGYKYSLQPIDIYQKPTDKTHKQTTWRISLAHRERTLTTNETNKLLDGLAAAARAKLKAERI